MKLLHHSYENELARLAEEALVIKVAIAFLTEGGLGWLPPTVAPRAQFIVGTGLGITSPGALKKLQSAGASVLVFQEPGRLFHPKVLYFKSQETQTLVIGSNNLTSSGISSNHEVSVSITRNRSTEAVFSDFDAYFRELKRNKECCGIPDDKFYETYRQSSLHGKLGSQLKKQTALPVRHVSAPIFKIEEKDIGSLGDFLRLLSKEFPKLDRRTGVKVKEHPLRILNEKQFRPLFDDIVMSVSNGRLKAHSNLTIGGNWYRIPNILATHTKLEPWAYTHERGRLVLQIHFEQDFSRAYLSAVLQFNLHRSQSANEMPPQVADRYRKLLEHVENASSQAKVDLPAFRHWNYKNEILWGKPIISYVHSIASLPPDKELCAELEHIATIVNGGPAIT